MICFSAWVPPTIYNHIDTPTSFGMAGSTEDSGSALLELLLFFKWLHATVLLDYTNGLDLHSFIAISIRSLLIRQRKYDVLSIENVRFSTKDEQSMRDALRQANNRSRGHAAGDLNALLTNRSTTLYGTKLENGFQPLDLYHIRETYNSVLLFANLVNQSLNQNDIEGYNLTDKELCSGKRLKALAVNRTFDLPSGPVFIDANGYRHVDFILLTFNNASGSHQRTAYFNYLQQTYVLDRNMTIEWVGQRVPRDVPVCGFSGLDGICMYKGITSTTEAGVATVVGFVCGRRHLVPDNYDV
ncbi:hypothetical protein BV898_12814 [Hypsibius exemplaris]|uniref:Receptor ligand binding region domain-containing protein n=1 Tax=Hypsibius exemplaris TaxID=2072580 RepID=A0A1W0WCK3_HYPEX|nr:hypothetical protein BV898_12814 [Hypsibius exemplaris]